MAGGLPRQDVSEAKKIENDRAWYKQYIDAVVLRHYSNNSQRLQKIARMYDEYNGLVRADQFAQYNNTYGPDKKNLAQYIDYRLCRGNLDLFVGEELEAPINGTVYTTNPEAHVQKLEHISTIVGMHVASAELDNLKQKTGVNIFDGMQPPEVPQEKTIFETLSPKLKNELIMQRILIDQIPALNLKLKFSDNISDVTLTSECFGKTDIDADNNVQYRAISPDFALYEESDKDPFVEKSPYLGEIRPMFIHDILREYKLTKDESDELETLTSGITGLDQNQRKCYEYSNGQLTVFVYCVEWKGVETSYIKTTIKDGETIEAQMSSEYYEKNKQKVDREVSQGKYTLVAKYKTVLYQADRIGHNIYKNLDKAKNIPFSLNKPAWTDFHYTGLLFNTKNGVRISIKQLTEHIDRAYNNTMWQINRELAKSKGKVMVYDAALLPKVGKKTATIKDIMYNMTNDSLVVINTAADGNASGRDALSASGFASIDLGLSNSFTALLALKLNLEQMADRITGINPNRRGQISASATVANTDTAIERSTTATAALTYFFYQYKEKVIRKVLDMNKVVCLTNPEKFEMLLGTEAMQYMKATKDMAFDDYRFTLGDARKEQNIREIIRGYFQQSINAGTGRIQDAIEFETAETMTEALAVIKKGWKEVQTAQRQDAQAQAQMQQQGQVELQQGQMQMQNDKDANVAKQIALRGQVDIAKQTAKQANDHVIQQSQQAVQK